ncbi:MAG: cation-translocating P-type ATPase [Leifsonia sp.]
MPAIDLAIDGMTCASCVARVEGSLGALDGVRAEVNLATERAHVAVPDGMDATALIAAVRGAGYSATVVPAVTAARSEAQAPARDPLLLRLVVSAALTVPVVALAMIPALHAPAWQWLAIALAAPVVAWGGAPFHRAAVAGIRHRAVGMDALVSLGTITAFAWSIVAMLTTGQVYAEVAAVVTTALLLGRFLEARTKRRAGEAMRALLDLGAAEATVLVDGAPDARDLLAPIRREQRIPVEQLQVGAIMVVRPGESIAADGVVVDGGAAVDESMLTGESAPIEVTVGSAVTGGTIVHGGRLVVRATRVGADTRLAQIAGIVERAQLGRSGAQRLADRVSAVFVPVVIGLAAITLAGWLLAGAAPTDAVTAAVAVLIVACPCALGLATPIAILVGTGRGASRGLLMRGGAAIEAAGRVDTVVFDKTGTLTSGRMSVRGIRMAAGEEGGRGAALRLAAAVEAGSEHPLARAVVAAARTAGEAIPTVGVVRAIPGGGVSGSVDGVLVVVGSPSFVSAE